MIGRLSSLDHCTSQTQLLLETRTHTCTQSAANACIKKKSNTHTVDPSRHYATPSPYYHASVHLITSISARCITQFINSSAYVKWKPIRTSEFTTQVTIYSVFYLRRCPFGFWMRSCNMFLSFDICGKWWSTLLMSIWSGSDPAVPLSPLALWALWFFSLYRINVHFLWHTGEQLTYKLRRPASDLCLYDGATQKHFHPWE